MRKGLTLIEIVIVIALLVILAGTYFFVANPGGQLAASRNTKRKLDLENVMGAVRQNIAEAGNGQFQCSSGPVPTSTTIMGSGAGQYNIAPCVTATLFVLPTDPAASSSYFNSPTDYNTGYSIAVNASGVITLAAPNAELGKIISISR